MTEGVAATTCNSDNGVNAKQVDVDATRTMVVTEAEKAEVAAEESATVLIMKTIETKYNTRASIIRACYANGDTVMRDLP